MPKYRKKIWSGDVYEVEEFYCPRSIGKKYERGMNENLTSEEQEKRNLKLARKKMTRLVNANFGGEDYFVLLTFSKEVTREEAKKDLGNFWKRLGRWKKKRGEELKYIWVLEEQGKIHFHIIMNEIKNMNMKQAWEVLQEKWGNGLVLIKKMKKNQPDMKLANYLTKEKVKKGERRWKASRNLKQPKVKIEQLGEKPRKPYVPKGYDLVWYTEDFYVEIGWVRFLKAVKKGGCDFGADNSGTSGTNYDTYKKRIA